MSENQRPFTSAILVAAGGSTRMGVPKQTIPLCGIPVIVRTLLAFEDEEAMRAAVERVIKEGLSVRALEKLARQANAQAKEEEKTPPVRRANRFYDEVALSLNEHLGRKVRVAAKSKDKGVLEIEFYSEEDLAELARLLGREE